MWQSIGGQEVGSIWGHGAYVAPDWSADWLHRESELLLNRWAKVTPPDTYESLDDETKAVLLTRLKKEMRTNTYQPNTGNLVISADRAFAYDELSQHYTSLFGNDPAFDKLRDSYAIPRNAITDPARQKALSAFFFWAAWSCSTERPGNNITYTNNWPHESLVGNTMTGSMVIWSVVSFVLLLAGVGALAWYYAAQKHHDGEERFPDKDPLLGLAPTPSMKATLKFFWVVTALVVAQAALGVITAHYQVEGSSFYGIPIAEWIPYSVTRTWHTQLGIFWIATAWLATGLFVAPAVSGHEPKYTVRSASG